MARKPEKIVSIAPFYQSKTPSRNCVFQHPALVKLGEEICKDYETSLADARSERDHRIEAIRFNAWCIAKDAEFEAKLAAEAANEPGVPVPVSAYESSFGSQIMAA